MRTEALVDQNIFYMDMGKHEKDVAIGYLISCLLRSRGDNRFISNSLGYDEDVNIYIAHLLLSLIDPASIERLGKYVSKSDQDVFKLVEDSTDSVFKFLVYRVNADNILVSLGIFNSLGTSFKDQHAFFGRSRDSYMGRGKIYYQFAASYSKETGKSHSGLPEVLTKLSDGFEKYAAILTGMRGEYLHLAQDKAPQRFKQMEEEFKRMELECGLQKKTDELLDLYLEWQKRPDPRLKEKLLAKAEEIRRLDPTFQFTLP